MLRVNDSFKERLMFPDVPLPVEAGTVLSSFEHCQLLKPTSAMIITILPFLIPFQFIYLNKQISKLHTNNLLKKLINNVLCYFNNSNFT